MSRDNLPTTPVTMLSYRDYRLSSLSGWVQQFKRGIPARVPPQAIGEALDAGCEIVQDDPMPVVHTPPVVTAPVDIKTVVVNETVVENTQDPREASIDDAIRLLLVRGDGLDFKNDGTPKILSVSKECGNIDPKPTATEVSDRFIALQDDISLAED